VVFSPYSPETAFTESSPHDPRAAKSRLRYRTFKALNIASLPKYSPFRYPGGKTWLIPQIRSWLRGAGTATLIEPFAGGATASLVAVLEGFVQQAVLVERDRRIAAVWRTILSSECEWLIDRILSFKVNRTNVMALLAQRVDKRRELAFQTLVLNRVRAGGILSNSASMIRQGERNRGLASRWYPETLSLRIADIYQHRTAFEIINGDGLRVIRKYVWQSDVRFFIDPPYPFPHRTRPLYAYNQVDHVGLLRTLRHTKGDFLLTYRDIPIVRNWAITGKFRVRRAVLQGNRGKPTCELLLQRA
jgi:DNA adenine methylase